MVLCCRVLIAASLLATIASTLRVYPHQLAYFNELARGPENGYKHLLGSNFDWGQDLILAAEHTENTHGTVSLFNCGVLYDPAFLSSRLQRPFLSLHQRCEFDGYAVVPVHFVHHYSDGSCALKLGIDDLYFKAAQDVQRIGFTAYLVYLSSNTE